MGTITSADSILTLSIPPLFSNPQQLQGFAADDIFDIPAITSIEEIMGVDGVLSAGFVFVAIQWEISLQADSASNLVFDTWWTQMQATKSTYPAQGVIKLPSVNTKFILSNGFLKSYKPAPPAKRVLQPRRYGLVFQKIAPQPA